MLPVLACLLLITPVYAADNEGDTAATLSKKLNARVTIEPLDKIPLKEVLDFFSNKHDLTLIVDPLISELRDGGGPGAVANVEEFLEQKVSLPKLKKVKLETALQYVLDQVQAKFLIMSDHIKIVDRQVADRQTGIHDPDPIDAPSISAEMIDRVKPLTRRALVQLHLKQQPLATVLEDLAESTGTNIVLGADIGELPKALITLKLKNTPLNVAVEMIAEQVGLAVVEKANVLLVTTKERAKVLQDKEKAIQTERELRQSGILPGMQGNGGGLFNPLGFNPMQPQTELELNAEDRELFDRIEKLLIKLTELKK